MKPIQTKWNIDAYIFEHFREKENPIAVIKIKTIYIILDRGLFEGLSKNGKQNEFRKRKMNK